MRFNQATDAVTVSFTIKPERLGGFVIYFRYHLNGKYWRSSRWTADTRARARAIVRKVLVSHWDEFDVAADLGTTGFCNDCDDRRTCEFRGCPRRTTGGTSENLDAFEAEFSTELARVHEE